VAELVDALASGASGFTAVKVRVLSWAPLPLPSDASRRQQYLADCLDNADVVLDGSFQQLLRCLSKVAKWAEPL
jgi:hypothetical protein